MSDQRELFESAVVDRLKESGFLEIEIRTECLVRCDDGYQDEVINAGWHYWNAALASALTLKDDPGKGGGGEAERLRRCLETVRKNLIALAWDENGPTIEGIDRVLRKGEK